MGEFNLKKFIITSIYSKGSQAAVQGGHASDELSLKMKKEDTVLSKLYWTWSEEFKTYVYLEVGSPKEIEKLENWISENKDELEVSSANFKEEELNNTVTACCFVAPKKLCENIQYNVKNLLTKMKEKGLRKFEFDKESFKFFEENFSGSWEDLAGYYPVHFVMNGDKIKVFVKAEETMCLGSYTPNEFNFFLKVRFLRLA